MDDTHFVNKCKDILKRKNLVTYTDEMPETPFYEEEYASKEWAQVLEPLDNKYRPVILLYYMEGFNIREISEILDMKESTVKPVSNVEENRLQKCISKRSGRDVHNEGV